MSAVAIEGEMPTPSPPARRRTARGLLLSTLAAALVIAVAGAAGGQGGGAADAAAGAARSEAVAIGESETAWEALKPHTPDGTAHEVFVHEVLRANEVDARELRPGDVLRVPVDGGR